MVEATMEVQGVMTMPGRKSTRMANITATLPVQLLDKIDELVDEEKVPSRSYVIREAVRKYLKEFEHK
jgi:metal-responsive CopG/Arc/MetJ family transcriptional regulator